MRLFLTLTITVLLLALPGVSSSFGCALMPTDSALEEPCSKCPVDKKQSCPDAGCVLLCPYTIERTASMMGGSVTDELVPQFEQGFGLILRMAPEPSRFVSILPSGSDPGSLYLINCVFLI